MKRRTLDSLDRVECLFYAIRTQNDRVLPSILKSNSKQLEFWKKVIVVCKDILTPCFRIDAVEQIRMFVRRSSIMDDIDILGGILIFNKKPKAWDLENIRKIDLDFYEGMLNASRQIGKISRKGIAPVISGKY